jgi:hypothetical protein
MIPEAIGLIPDGPAPGCPDGNISQCWNDVENLYVDRPLG